jgi:hypothetical protein
MRAGRSAIAEVRLALVDFAYVPEVDATGPESCRHDSRQERRHRSLVRRTGQGSPGDRTHGMDRAGKEPDVMRSLVDAGADHLILGLRAPYDLRDVERLVAARPGR